MGAAAATSNVLISAVADTGPVLHLWEAGALDVLAAMGAIVIPPSVDSELAHLIPGWSSLPTVWITVERLTPPHDEQAGRWYAAGLLDRGEAEAVALARQRGADWLLTDDMAARLLAQSLGIEAHGSLGVVLWAAATGRLGRADAEAALERLAKSSLWVSTRVLREARDALKELFQ